MYKKSTSRIITEEESQKLRRISREDRRDIFHKTGYSLTHIFDLFNRNAKVTEDCECVIKEGWKIYNEKYAKQRA